MTKHYIGTKEVTAWAQPRVEMSDAGKEIEVAGYAVKYADGYTSWSPKDVFEQAYRASEGEHQALTFGDALHYLKLGRRVSRPVYEAAGIRNVGEQVIAARAGATRITVNNGIDKKD